MVVVSYAWDDLFEFLVTVVEMEHTRMPSPLTALQGG